MLYFITNDAWHLNHYKEALYPGIEVVEDTNETFDMFKNFVDLQSVIGYDVESNGLDAWVNRTIIKTIGNEETQFILHSPFIHTGRYFKYMQDRDITLLGHNIKFDLKMLYVETGIWYRKVIDTMLADQRVYMKLGLSSSLENVTKRYLDKFPDAMDKSIRLEFVGSNIHKFKVEHRHLTYGASDVTNLFPIMKKLEEVIKKYEMDFLLNDIEYPLISIIAKAEVTGFEFDKENWTAIYKDNIDSTFNIECELDEEFRRIRDIKVSNGTVDPIYITGGKFDNQRIKNPVYDLFNADGTTNTLDLFGEPMKINTFLGSKAKNTVKVKKAPNNTNYGSDTQILEIFGRLGEPLLDKGENIVEVRFNKKQKVDRSIASYTTNEGALTAYLSMLPESIMGEFIKLLLKHRGLTKATSTYGMNFINNLNVVTGRLHTSFGQCFTNTGRMSSGGGDLEPDKPNFQNIPSKADYAIRMRNCFLAKKGYSIGTHDLSGAELIIMCSISQDFKLLEIAQKDIHSYVAQGCWRAIYKARAEQFVRLLINDSNNLHLQEEYRKNIQLANTYIVDKSHPKIRTAFKPMTFGTIYGMYAGKAAKTLNITKDEGQIVIDFIKREFPDVFRMVEHASRFATEKGYLVLNSRTKSRAWFPNIIHAIRGTIDPKESWKIISKEQSEARNIKIQGTQADMIKECTVEIQKWIDSNNYTNDITILSWVHDELVDQHPQYIDGVSDDWQEWINEGNFLTYNNEYYPSFAKVKAQIMRDVCNKYLHNVKMDVDYDVMPFWTK